MPFTLVESIFGPILIGVFINVALWGVMFMQYCFYQQHFSQDKLGTKLLVHFLFLLDTLNTACNIAYVYIGLISNFTKVLSVLDATVLLATDPILTGLIACIAQLFFAYRIQRLISHWWLTAIVFTLSVVQFLAAVSCGVAGVIVGSIARFGLFQSAVIVWLVCAALADVTIAVSLVLYFRQRRTGFAFTDQVIARITLLTMETGSITALMAIVNVIAFLASPASALHLGFNYTLAKLYSNSLLASLNARAMTGQQPTSNSFASTGRSTGRGDTIHISSRNVSTGKLRSHDNSDMVELAPYHVKVTVEEAVSHSV